MNTKEKIEVMQAWVDGKKLKACKTDEKIWYDVTGEPEWIWGKFEYRVKKEPIERWVIMEEGTNVLWSFFFFLVQEKPR